MRLEQVLPVWEWIWDRTMKCTYNNNDDNKKKMHKIQTQQRPQNANTAETPKCNHTKDKDKNIIQKQRGSVYKYNAKLNPNLGFFFRLAKKYFFLLNIFKLTPK